MGLSFVNFFRKMSTFVHNATSKHTATVIFLHGLGDTGNGWLHSLKAISSPHIKYVCPTAPTIPVSLNCGMPMPSWFDIYSLQINASEDEEGINAAADLLQELINKEEAAGIPRSRIVIGGFSQGGALALYSALAKEQAPLAGVIVLSSWLTLHQKFPEALKSNQTTPILQCHGLEDPMVAFNLAEKSFSFLKKLNNNCKFKAYNGLGHSSCELEMRDVEDFIKNVLPPI